jgi:hypothetical protein
MGGGADDAGRLLGPQRGTVVGALRVVEKEHEGVKGKVSVKGKQGGRSLAFAGTFPSVSLL